MKKWALAIVGCLVSIASGAWPSSIADEEEGEDDTVACMVEQGPQGALVCLQQCAWPDVITFPAELPDGVFAWPGSGEVGGVVDDPDGIGTGVIVNIDELWTDRRPAASTSYALLQGALKGGECEISLRSCDVPFMEEAFEELNARVGDNGTVLMLYQVWTANKPRC